MFRPAARVKFALLIAWMRFGRARIRVPMNDGAGDGDRWGREVGEEGHGLGPLSASIVSCPILPLS